MIRRNNQSFFDQCITRLTSLSRRENSHFKTVNGTKRALTRSKSCAKWQTWPSSLRNKCLKYQARILILMRSWSGLTRSTAHLNPVQTWEICCDKYTMFKVECPNQGDRVRDFKSLQVIQMEDQTLAEPAQEKRKEKKEKSSQKKKTKK